MPFFKLFAKTLFSLILLGTIYYFSNHFFITPKQIEKTTAEQRLKQAEHLVEASVAAYPDPRPSQRKLQQIEAETPSLKEKLAGLETGLLTIPELQKLMGSMVSKGAEEKNGDYANQTFKVHFDGLYNDFFAFLDSLERNSPYLEFQSLEIAQDKDSLKEFLHANLEMRALYRSKPHEGENPHKLFASQNTPIAANPFAYIQKQDPPSVPESNLLYLTEIIFRGADRYAKINGGTFRSGEELPGGARLKEVGNKEVLIQQDATVYSLKMN